jgi:hypothetical protein
MLSRLRSHNRRSFSSLLRSRPPRSWTTSSQPNCQPDVEELWVAVAAEVGNIRVGIVSPQALPPHGQQFTLTAKADS